jgi:death on curing protein
MSTDPPFIDESIVLDIHRDQLERYGGRDGIRDENSLKSALAMPQAGFGDTFFHHFPFGMAAAYIFHIAENQPFVDGNKRTELAAGLTFLDACGMPIEGADDRVYQAMIDMGNRKLTKEQLEKLLENLAKSKE